MHHQNNHHLRGEESTEEDYPVGPLDEALGHLVSDSKIFAVFRSDKFLLVKWC
jgi:hypothetical protein